MPVMKRRNAAGADDSTSPVTTARTPDPECVDDKNLKAQQQQQAIELNRVQPFVEEYDFIDFLYRPHTVAALLISIVGVMAAVSWYRSAEEVTNVKLGILGAAVVFVIFGCVHLPDSLMVRPHPAVWRGVLAVAILYLMLMVFLLFQDLETIHKIMGFIDPKLTKPLPERSYAEDCRMSTPEDPYKWINTIWDEFLLAHAIGYWAKTIALRDWRVVTAVSIGFEILEVTLQHILPNFRECWWDHVIADVLICNAGGTVMGIITLRLLKAKEYRWVKLKEIPTIRGKAKRVLSQLAPRFFMSYQWLMFKSPKRLLQVMLVMLVVFTQEINCFTMKRMLWMEPQHPIVVLRLAAWGFFALVGLREFYDYIGHTTVKRMGPTSWVAAFAIFLEFAFLAKFAYQGNHFRNPWPAHVVLPWIYAISAFVLWFALYFGTGCHKESPRRRRLWNYFLNLLWCSIFLAFLFLFFVGNPDLKWKQREFDHYADALGLWPLVKAP